MKVKLRIYKANPAGKRGMAVNLPIIMARAAHIEPGDDMAIWLYSNKKCLVIAKDSERPPL